MLAGSIKIKNKERRFLLYWKQTGLLGEIYLIACLLIQIVLLWGFHKRMDILRLVGLAFIIFRFPSSITQL